MITRELLASRTEKRLWHLYSRLAWWLPRDLILACVKRFAIETEHQDDPLPVLSLPLRDYTRRWEEITHG